MLKGIFMEVIQITSYSTAENDFQGSKIFEGEEKKTPDTSEWTFTIYSAPSPISESDTITYKQGYIQTDIIHLSQN